MTSFWAAASSSRGNNAVWYKKRARRGIFHSAVRLQLSKKVPPEKYKIRFRPRHARGRKLLSARKRASRPPLADGECAAAGCNPPGMWLCSRPGTVRRLSGRFRFSDHSASADANIKSVFGRDMRVVENSSQPANVRATRPWRAGSALRRAASPPGMWLCSRRELFIFPRWRPGWP